MTRWNAPLRYAVFELTNRCNLRCPHCGSDSGVARPGELTVDEWLLLVDEVSRLGGVEVTLLGGEVFLFSGWEQVARQVRERGMRLVVITNGLLIDDVVFHRLVDCEPFLVGVSVDGPDPERYDRVRGVDGFHSAIETARRLVHTPIPHVNVITTLTRMSLAWWKDFVEAFRQEPFVWQVQLANKGSRRFDDRLFLTLEDYAWWVDAVRGTLDRYPDLRIRFMDDFGYVPLDPGLAFLCQTWRGCMAGRSLVGIRSDGFVSPCLSLGESFLEASVKDHSLEEIWRSSRWFSPFRRRSANLTGGCASCEVSDRCGGGCAAMAWSATGSLGDNPYCIRRIEARALTRQVWGAP